MRQQIAFPPRAGRDLLLPETLEIIDIIAEIHHVPAVGIFQQPPGTPLPAVVDNQHIKPAVEQIVCQFRILNVGFDAAGADDNNAIVVFRTKTHKAHRNIIHAQKLIFFALLPEICQRTHGERRESGFP